MTGLGSPVANRLIYDLAGVGAISGTVFQDNNGNGTRDAGEPSLPGVTVYLDANDNGAPDPGGTVVQASSDVPKAIPDYSTAGASSTLVLSGTGGAISNVTITLSITHARDGDLAAYLISPDGTTVTLFDGVGSNGDNFTNTTLSDQAAVSITSGSPPFTGTYHPSPGSLSAFDGQAANGTWTLEVVDSRRQNEGTIDAWSLTVTTAEEVSTVTDGDGSYSFSPLQTGTYTVRQVVPAGTVQTGPDAGATPSGAYVVTVSGAVGGEDFGVFPTTFTADQAGESFYVTLDPTSTYLRISASAEPLEPPTYQVAAALLPGLTFDLLGEASSIAIDFANGSPIPAGGLAVHGASGAGTSLKVLGQTPAQVFTFTDGNIGPVGSAAIVYQDISGLWLYNCTVNFTGTLGTLEYLYIGRGTTFYWF